MEYLRGADLATLLQREGRFSPARAGRLLVQLCEVLQAAHDAGIVHRDIKPGNLMILHPGTPQETLKLMDFGLARMSSMLYISPDEVFDWNLPAASGTPEYISPEMVRGNELDGRCDLYSVGVVLYEMLSGRRPFLDPSVEALMLAHASQRPPRFAELGLGEQVPAEIENVVRACLAKYPDQRPRTAWDLALAYEKALGRRIMPSRQGVPAGGGTGLGASAQGSGVRQPAPGSGVWRAVGSGVRQAEAAPVPAAPAVDRNAFRHSVEATMPEAMAMIKLKGFIHDLGGEILDSVPGMIKVRLGEKPAATQKKSGLVRILGAIAGGSRQTSVLPAAPVTDVELHMERLDPAQANKLTITLVMRPAGGIATADWRNRCAQIGRDLQAYLMGR
jgi:serine/threonine-protein kinase